MVLGIGFAMIEETAIYERAALWDMTDGCQAMDKDYHVCFKYLFFSYSASCCFFLEDLE